MTTYAYDSYGAPVEIYDEEQPPVVALDWKGQDIREDEQVLSHIAWFRYGNELKTTKKYLFEDDIYEYIKTLEHDDLLEILEKIDEKDIIEAADMEKTYL